MTSLNLEEDEEEEYTLNLEDEEEDVMIQEDYEVQSDSSSDVPDTNKIVSSELIWNYSTLRRFQHTNLDGHRSLERETDIS